MGEPNCARIFGQEHKGTALEWVVEDPKYIRPYGICVQYYSKKRDSGRFSALMCLTREVSTYKSTLTSNVPVTRAGVLYNSRGERNGQPLDRLFVCVGPCVKIHTVRIR